MTPSMLVWPIFANAPPSLASVIGTSFVTIVMSAAISDPVASVPMNESIFMTTTTTRVDHADPEADGERDRDRRDERNPVLRRSGARRRRR